MSYNRLKLYYIEEEYINYLREYDKKVPYNKDKTRPYVGVVYTYRGSNYFAPLTSPKPKHLKMSNRAIDIWKIDNGKLGILNFNNMLPSPIEVLTEVIPTIKNEKYKILLNNQISSINADRDILLKKIERFHEKYRKNQLSNNVVERCCDFELLEKKCNEYISVGNERIINQVDDFKDGGERYLFCL